MNWSRADYEAGPPVHDPTPWWYAVLLVAVAVVLLVKLALTEYPALLAQAAATALSTIR